MDVSYPVDAEIQPSSNTCWLTCLRMLARFRLSVGRPLNEFAMVLLNDDFAARFAAIDRPMRTAAFSRIAPRFGLSEMSVPGLTSSPESDPSALLDPLAAHHVLRTRGPFTMGVISHGSAHAIVVCGARSEDPFEIEYIDPADGFWCATPHANLQHTYPPDGGPLYVF